MQIEVFWFEQGICTDLIKFEQIFASAPTMPPTPDRSRMLLHSHNALNGRDADYAIHQRTCGNGTHPKQLEW